MQSGALCTSRTGQAAALLVLMAFLALPGGCASGEPVPLEPVAPAVPVLVIGVDGLEWDILLPLLRQGEVPALAALMERGVWGKLETLEPTLSPVIWTSIATGRTPGEHGIVNFTTQGENGEPRLFLSSDRKVRAVWDVLSEAGRSVNVVGWWNTWPAEPVNGVLVSQASSLQQGRKVWKGTVHEDWPDQTWPPDLFAEILPVVRQVNEEIPEDLPAGDGPLPAAVQRFVPALPPSPTPFELRLLSDSLWSFRADTTYARITLLLLRDHPADLTLTYLGSADVTGHRFYRHFRPALYVHAPRPEGVVALGGVIPATYRYLDDLIGRLVAAAGPDTSVLVISDHGMGPVNESKDFEAAFAQGNPRYSLAAVNSGHHLRAQPGVIVAAGPAFGPGGAGPDMRDPTLEAAAVPALGNIYQVAPTLIYLAGLPVSAELTGHVMTSILAPGRLQALPVASLPTYEMGPRPGQAGKAEGGPEVVDEERLRQLKSLGYVE